MNFYDFFFITEATFAGEDPLAMNVDDVDLQGSPGSYSYTFKIDNENYRVSFDQTNISLNDGSGYKRITDKAYSIVFSGPNGVSLTGRGKAMTVYKSLIKSVKKLIDVAKPEGLQFYGAQMEQEIMYHSFYDKFLHKAFTAASAKDYVANWFIEQLKSSGDPRYAVLEKAIEAEKTARPERSEQMSQQKADKRVRRQQNAERLASIQQHLQKIAFDANNQMPVYLYNIDADNGVVLTRYISGRYLDSSSVAPDQIKPIDEMPASSMKTLQKLAAKLKADGTQVQFYGNPPDGWDQQGADPMSNISKKIAYSPDHGPIFVNNYDDYYDEVSFYYVSGSYLDSSYVKSDRVQPIDQMPQEYIRTLRKLIRKVEENNGPFTPQFYGNPPSGWDQQSAAHQAQGKIAFNRDYGPVYVEKSEDGESKCAYTDRSGYFNRITIEDNDLEQTDQMPSVWFPKLQKLLEAIRRRLNVTSPQFYGNPPQGWSEHSSPQRMVGQIAWTNWTETPVYIQSINGEQAVVLYHPIDSSTAATSGQLQRMNVDLDGIEPIGRDNRSWRFRRGWDQLLAGLQQMGISNAREWQGDGQRPSQDDW